MPRIHRCRHRRPQIHITQTHHQIGRLKKDPPHLVDALQPVDPPNELQVARAPRRIRPHTLHVAPDRLLRARIIPTDRQMHHPRRHLDRLQRRQCQNPFPNHRPQRLPRHHLRIKMHLQRPDPRCQIQNPRQPLLLDPFIDHVRLEPQLQVQMMRPELNQKVPIPRPSHHYRVVALAPAIHKHRSPLCFHRLRQRRHPTLQKRRHLRLPRHRPGLVHRHKLHLISGPQLTQLPQLRIHHHRRTHKPTQTRPVRPQNDRHVPREIHRPDRIRIVMQIRRMQSRLAPVTARPLRLRPDQSHACPRRVVMHLPGRLEEHCHVLLQKEIRRPMRPIKHPDPPHIPNRHRPRRALHLSTFLS